MTLWFPKSDLMFHDLKACPVGRFKLWVHYNLFHGWVYRWLPQAIRRPVYEAMRRWLFGPDANHEELRAILDEAIAAVGGLR